MVIDTDQLKARGWTDEQVNEVQAYLDSLDFHDDYEFADNFRVARPDNPDDEDLYERAAMQGCCGSHNHTLPSGIKVGFNYGH